MSHTSGEARDSGACSYVPSYTLATHCGILCRCCAERLYHSPNCKHLQLVIESAIREEVEWRPFPNCPLFSVCPFLCSSPPDPHQNFSRFILSEDEHQNLLHIASVPNHGIHQVRIHWLLDLVTATFVRHPQITWVGVASQLATPPLQSGPKWSYQVQLHCPR